MKKAYALVFLLSVGIVAQAQDNKSFRFGIKVAPNFGFINPDTKELKNDGARFGFTFGLMGDFMFGSDHNYAFATGLLLNNVGGRTALPYLNTNLSTEAKYQYIEVPITLKLMTNEIGYITYYGQIGFAAAFNIAAKSDFDDISSGKVVRVADEDIMESTNPFKASLVVGAGLHYNFSGNTALLVGVTYNNGFTNILKDQKIMVGTEEKDLKAKLNYLELTLGVFF
jgi:hypothetical protein